jgi:hypothetical protein
LGRFGQPDSVVPGAGDPRAWDRFSYVKNNPILFSDPSGHRITCGDGEVGGCGGGASKTIPINQNRFMKHGNKMIVVNGWTNAEIIPDVIETFKNYASEDKILFFGFNNVGGLWKPTKEEIAEGIINEILNHPNDNYYIVGYSAGGSATIWALDTLPIENRDQIISVVLIEPAFEPGAGVRHDYGSNLSNVNTNYNTLILSTIASSNAIDYPKNVYPVIDMTAITHIDIPISYFTQDIIIKFFGIDR